MPVWSKAEVEYLDKGTVTVNDVAGTHIKIGYCTGLAPGQFVTLTDEDSVYEKLGAGPLAEACLDTIQVQGGTVIAIAAAASVAGTSTDITHVGTGQATFVKGGTPNGEYDVVLEITQGGALNAAQYKVSLDGGDSWSQIKTVPVDGIVDTGTGITITFSEAVDPATSFVAGDTYSFKTTAPSMSNQDFLDAMDVVKNNNFVYEFIHVVGETAPALWAVCATEADALEAQAIPTFFVCETRNIDDTEDPDTYVQALISEKGSFAHERMCVVAARLELADLRGRQQDKNAGGIVAGIIGKSKIEESAGKVRKYNLAPPALAIKPDGLNEGHLKQLNDAGFTVCRTYNQYPGIYIEEANLMSPPGSDYMYVKDRKLADTAGRLAYQAGMFYMKSEMFEDELDNLKANMEVPLDQMVKKRHMRGYELNLVTAANDEIVFDLEVQEVGSIRKFKTRIRLERG